MSEIEGVDRALGVLQWAVLRSLQRAYENELCLGLGRIVMNTGVPREIARGFLAGLREDGSVEYHRGLMTEDGEVAGSGYCLSSAGYALLVSQAEGGQPAHD